MICRLPTKSSLCRDFAFMKFNLASFLMVQIYKKEVEQGLLQKILDTFVL